MFQLLYEPYHSSSGQSYAAKLVSRNKFTDRSSIDRGVSAVGSSRYA